ncbi:MAG TPA: lipopolysaccharide heptosyltransferase II [Blastocatellia bacterium]|nr:lipopolysaccharide heptosyltransferase II [Blastocatellia bacterium]
MTVRSCIVRAPNWIGDAVMSLGALREIRRALGDAELAIAARPWVAGIYEEARVADQVIQLERRSWRDAFAAARGIRSGQFDCAVLLQNAFEAALVMRLAGVPRIVGYPSDGRGILLTDSVALAPNASAEHQTRYYGRIARGFEEALFGASHVDLDRLDVTLTPSETAVARAHAILMENGVPPGSPIVAINPGATNSRAKQWLPERFAAVGDTLARRHDAHVVIVGSGNELDTAMAVQAAMADQSRSVVVAGATTVQDLIGILSLASALVSNDTGPAHLGAALGIPTVTIFGPTEQFATHPVGAHATTVSEPVDCAPCMLRDCPIDHPCMTRLTVDKVLGAVESVSGAGSA